MASVLIPLAPGCEQLEAVTIIDLLVRAGVEVVSATLIEWYPPRGVTLTLIERYPDAGAGV